MQEEAFLRIPLLTSNLEKMRAEGAAYTMPPIGSHLDRDPMYPPLTGESRRSNKRSKSQAEKKLAIPNFSGIEPSTKRSSKSRGSNSLRSQHLFAQSGYTQKGNPYPAMNVGPD